jgi:hypothetical protein
MSGRIFIPVRQMLASNKQFMTATPKTTAVKNAAQCFTAADA